jgi:tRNA G46 methylase TrmB
MEEYLTTFGKFKIWKNDLVIIESLKKGYVYDEDIIRNKLNPYIQNSKYILDVGAHIGSHCISYSKLNPKAEIVAFEPQSKIFELLKMNCIENECKNIKLYNNCVGHISTEIELNSTIENEINKKYLIKL